MSRFLLALALLLAALVPSAGQAKRVALIIGMSDYQHLSSLINPVPDARAIAAELKSHGFEVSEYYNLDRADLLDALEKFKREATGAEAALVYYAGHGMEVDGKHVLAPTDMEIECQNKTALRSVALEQLFDASSPAPQQIVLLDACRTIRFPNVRRAARQARDFAGCRWSGRLTARCSSPKRPCRGISPPMAIQARIRRSRARSSRISTSIRASISAICST